LPICEVNSRVTDSGSLGANRRFGRWFSTEDGYCNLDRIKRGVGVGATSEIALSRGGTLTRLCMCVSLSSRDYHRADMVPIRREEETSVVSHQTGRVESSR
jgi:hypothetical protein